jgi:hypothetical protein
MAASLASQSTSPETPKKAAPAKKSTKKSSKSKKKSSTAPKSSTQKAAPPSATKKATSSKSSSKSKSKRAATPRGQQRPTAERYKEIEEALVSRGYLQEEPTGKWSPNAVEALRSFQADHDLPPTGRIDSQSLMQLGLGPREHQ